MKKSNITMAGVTSGVGSMLIGGHVMGLKILGNVEWRRYYNTGTFEKYFKAPFTEDYEDIKHLKGANIVMVHDDCGEFSGLNLLKESQNKSDEEKMGMIPTTVKAIQDIKPDFFAMDNLPKMLTLLPIQWWLDKFPKYDLHFEWVSNHHYGNPQIYRKRLFVIGSKKKYKWKFIPDEVPQEVDLEDRLKGCEYLPNHIFPDPSDRIKNHFKIYDPRNPDKEYNTHGERAEFIMSMPPEEKRRGLLYNSPVYGPRIRPGTSPLRKDFAPVLSATNRLFHFNTGYQLTIRERARIQGFPDNFEFVLKPADYWNGKGFKQTGKSMPVEFTTYLTKQFVRALQGKKPIKASGQRLIPPNRFIEEAKHVQNSNKG